MDENTTRRRRHGRAGRRHAVGGALVVGAALAVTAAPADGAQQGQELDLDACYLSVMQFDDDAERLRPYVPPAYELAAPVTIAATSGTPQAPDRASFTLWTYSCEGVALDGTSLGPAELVLVGVVVQKPDAALPEPQFIASYDHYLTSAASDNPRLAAVLTSQGLPVQHVQEVSFERTVELLGRPSTTTSVPRPGEQLTFSVTPDVDDSKRGHHPHDNSFWHGTDPGAAAQLEIRMRALDWLCVVEGCGRASAPEGSPMAAFLGAPVRDDAVFVADHLLIDAVSATVGRGSGG